MEEIKEIETFETETVDDNNYDEDETREELKGELAVLEENETQRNEQTQALVEKVAKNSLMFAAGFAAGTTLEKVKNLKKHPEDATAPKEKKEHFWNRIHIQSPIKFDKKQKKEEAAPAEGEKKTETTDKSESAEPKKGEKKAEK